MANRRAVNPFLQLGRSSRQQRSTGNLLANLLGKKQPQPRSNLFSLGRMMRKPPQQPSGILNQLLGARSGQSTTSSLLNANNLNELVSNAQNTMRTVQKAMPVIKQAKQYGPLIKNLPSMIKLMRSLPSIEESTTKETPAKEEVNVHTDMESSDQVQFEEETEFRTDNTSYDQMQFEEEVDFQTDSELYDDELYFEEDERQKLPPIFIP